jgi:hypothetical protein
MGATNIRKPCALQQDQAGPTSHANFSSGCTIADGVETADLKAAKAYLNSLQRRAQVLAGLIFSGRSILTALLTY